MKSLESHIDPHSEYFQYTPSLTARNTFFYPICTGHFVYEPDYTLHRSSFDSFLLMYISQGQLTVDTSNASFHTKAGQFVLLDCYEPHGYTTATGWESLWLHFDGKQARNYYDLIQMHLGTVFTLGDSAPVLHSMEAIYHAFSTSEVIREALLSKQITDILTRLLLSTPADTDKASDSMADITSYINEHFAEDITIKDLAERALLSPYHFIRLFKKQVGFTPHEYLVNTRINTARYLLKNTGMSTKDICFQCGFSSESVFCNAFKKNTGQTPSAYRSDYSIPNISLATNTPLADAWERE